MGKCGFPAAAVQPGVGDFDADGTDDILLADPDNNLAAWKVKDGQTAGIITLA